MLALTGTTLEVHTPDLIGARRTPGACSTSDSVVPAPEDYTKEAKEVGVCPCEDFSGGRSTCGVEGDFYL